MNRSISQTSAILFAIAAFTLWVLVDSGIKLAAEAALPPYEVAEALGLVIVTIMLLKAGRRGAIKSLWPRNFRNQMVFALLSLGINLFNVVALKHLPLILFYVAVFTAPMIIAILAALFLRERLRMGQTLAILAGFAGVVIAINPASSALQGDWIGYLAAAGAVLCFAVSMVWMRRMSQTETSDSMVFFSSFVQVVACSFLMLGSMQPLTVRLAVILLGSGILNCAANMLNIASLKHAAAALVAQFHYTQIIAGALIGYLVWSEVPTPAVIIGSAIIIASGLYIAGHARKTKTAAAVKPL